MMLSVYARSADSEAHFDRETVELSVPNQNANTPRVCAHPVCFKRNKRRANMAIGI